MSMTLPMRMMDGMSTSLPRLALFILLACYSSTAATYNIGFFFAGVVNPPPGDTSVFEYPTFVHQDLDQSVPTPPPTASTDQEERPILRFHTVRHTSCSLPPSASLASHIQASCAQHIPQPIRRRDPRYVPPKKTSCNPLISHLPFRRTVLARGGSQSPSHHSASGFVSLKKNIWADDNDANEEEDFTNMIAPPDTNIAPDLARQTIAAFRSSCLVAARQCAVSGKGQSWCSNPAAGPALQTCHIIPQEHYHLYPDVDTEDDDNNIEYGLCRLRTAWQRTWSADNSILLLSHLHELFDARLFSIHPDTFQVRAFVPYDVVCEYHGRKARLPVSVDQAVLRHHYEMCCIENIGAKMPLMEPASVTNAGMGSLGITSLFMRADKELA
ncbi:hypothetical protein QBC33DRAFT_604003 [Phialemonium atrogriseum]|uniref:HNH nuclease domain-containing protein n=1 Tax=Phialemonium atrogriseum TaxID=1093897 RepID=A0AAJ0BPB7_9PEZI|nr:uncharacterized protein QBC33DRAFT_604003 [Phialemonium atrogriseum]KAK1761710.1 hypothetical protein QBC33DRAFT_604003 [Phialemonium atrogriseum]